MSGHGRDRHLPSSVPGAYRLAMAWTLIGWVATLALIVVVQFGLPAVSRWSVQDTLVIATISLLVAYISMLPGLRVSLPSGGILGAMVSGITIRLLGTVALFLTCRYQLASSAETIAGMTIGWYLLLTSIEVITLSRYLPKSLSIERVISATESGPIQPNRSSQ